MCSMRCLVCSDERRKDIDRDLVRLGNVSKVSQKYKLPYDSVYRHSREHLAAVALGAGKRSLKMHSERLFNELLELAATTKDILRSALDDNHRGLALKSIVQSRNNIEVLTRFILSMEELQMKQNTIEVQEQQQSSRWFREGWAALSEEDQETYREISIKMLAACGGNLEQEPADTLTASDQEMVRTRKPGQ